VAAHIVQTVTVVLLRRRYSLPIMAGAIVRGPVKRLERAMFIAYTVVGILLAFGVLGSATAQVTGNKVVIENLVHLGLPPGIRPFLASCLISGGVGLLVGIWYPPLGIAAAVGLVLYFVGALAAHLRKGDVKGLPIPTVFLLFAAAALALLALSS
jgi:DoxX-like family